MRSASILDVGHGNSAILLFSKNVVVVDIARAEILLDFLADTGIGEVDALIISHADADHVAGLVGVLASATIRIREVWINPDAMKATELWRGLCVAVAEYGDLGTVRVRMAINATDPGVLEFPGGSLRILSPHGAVALRGVGADVDGHVVTSNDHSVVIQVNAFGRNLMLLLGDTTPWAWEKIRARGLDLHADVVVLPHHGGSFGSPEEYQTLLADTSPKYAVASNGRNRNDNPRETVVKDVLARGVHMLCTQLSARCGAHADPRIPPHPACAGTITFNFGDAATVFSEEKRHREFVDLIGDTALCRRV